MIRGEGRQFDFSVQAQPGSDKANYQLWLRYGGQELDRHDPVHYA